MKRNLAWAAMFFILIFTTLTFKTFAATIYTSAQVAVHNTPADCWVIFQNQVYDITSYVGIHDSQHYFIDSWCGTDITIAYSTKDGQGRDHSAQAHALLQSFYIGDLGNNATPIPTPTQAARTINPTVKNPYDFWTPFLSITILYWSTSIYVKANRKNNPRLWPKFNLFWNTMIIIFLIPSAGFGLFMVFRYIFPELNKINFDFLWWHVEGAISFTVLVVSHFLNRFTQYLAPWRLFTRKH